MVTTKFKVISGFFGIMCVLAAVAALGYLELRNASEGFSAYLVETRIVTAADEAESLLHQTWDQLSRFRLGMREQHVKEARALAGRALDHLATAKKLERNARDQALLDAQATRITQAVQLMEEVRQKLSAGTNMVDEELTAASRATAAALANLATVGRRTNHNVVLEIIEEAYSHYADARVQVRHYSDIHLASSADKAEKALADFGTALTQLEPLLLDQAAKNIFAEVQRRHAGYAASFRNVRALFEAGLKAQAQIDAIAEELNKSFAEYTERTTKRMYDMGAVKQADNEQAQSLIMACSVVGLALGMLAATLIVMGLVRALRSAAAFAVSIAAGDFNVHVDIREKGEFGALLSAMQEIPDALHAILDEFNLLEDKIEAGDLAAKVDPTPFRGDFARLITDTDAIVDRFITILDVIPTPVMMMDKDIKVVWANALYRMVAGADCRGKTDEEISHREDIGTPDDGLQKAVRTLQSTTAETRAYPLGNVMDVRYTAMPLCDHAGKLASIFFMITDLTATKATQNTIRQVADQAASISDRVAASSEEISAQAEEVSRGAEEQRRRVENTATAMTEMNATVLEVAKNAGRASEQSEATRNKAHDGAELVNKVVHSINTVNKAATTLQTNMQELGGKAESIGGVMNVISDIADQTNLLALNAAIEAARAGDAGRGFAVVADEVRKLAEKTMTATKEVGANISAIQQSARINIREVDEAAKAITEATELANTSGRALTEIVNLASASSSVVASIATAAEEQSATSEEISHAIEAISKIAGESAEGMHQSSSALHELSRMAHELDSVMARLR